MQRIAETIAAEGGVDGVIGFSQGGAGAALLASLLETSLSNGFGSYRSPPWEKGTYDFASFLPQLRAANGDRPLKFAVVYSGFLAPPPQFAWLYFPPIRTPTLHFLGSLDTVVDEGRSLGLAEKCVDPVVVVHPGGHFVPMGKEWVAPLVGFVRQHAGETGGKVDGKEGQEKEDAVASQL
jgi:fermentation-respiration switch protein FrsA (DUF1100 family)